MKWPVYTFDAVIVGAGGAGMRAALQLANSGLKVALISKVFLYDPAQTQQLHKPQPLNYLTPTLLLAPY